MRETYLYPYSAEEACRRGEQSLWRASYLENIDCKDAIQKAVRQHYDGAHLDKECLTGVLQEFGYKRTAWVLANTVQQLEWGGQYSSENKAWASQIYIPPDKCGANPLRCTGWSGGPIPHGISGAGTLRS